MWIWIANKFAKFHTKRLNQSENIPTNLGGATFLKHPVVLQSLVQSCIEWCRDCVQLVRTGRHGVQKGHCTWQVWPLKGALPNATNLVSWNRPKPRLRLLQWNVRSYSAKIRSKCDHCFWNFFRAASKVCLLRLLCNLNFIVIWNCHKTVSTELIVYIVVCTLFADVQCVPKRETRVILNILYSCKSIAVKFSVWYADDLSY